MKIQRYPQASSTAKKLILFFNGWGTPCAVVEHLVIPEDYDLIICYDYHQLNIHIDLAQYEQINVMAWSMGVWVANQYCQALQDQIISAVAINGTGLSMHDDYGIAKATFVGTLAYLDELNLAKFNRRMCGSKEILNAYQQFEHRSIDNVKNELNFLYQQLSADSTEPQKIKTLPWNKAIIATQDRIFTAENQLRYWKNYNQQQTNPCKIEQLDTGHYPFLSWQAWEQIWQ